MLIFKYDVILGFSWYVTTFEEVKAKKMKPTRKEKRKKARISK